MGYAIKKNSRGFLVLTFSALPGEPCGAEKRIIPTTKVTLHIQKVASANHSHEALRGFVVHIRIFICKASENLRDWSSFVHLLLVDPLEQRSLFPSCLALEMALIQLFPYRTLNGRCHETLVKG
jgi:hypothetical protein